MIKRFINMAVTIRDVAKQAGASIAAVSSTLNGSRSLTIRVSADTRERIISAAAELGYVSNPIAKSLATGKTGTVGIMLPYAEAFVDHNPFCMTVMQGFMQTAIDSHLNVMLYTASDGVSDAKAATMVDSRVDGLVLVMPDEESAIISRLDARKVPYVSIMRKPCEGAWTVNSDDYQGARLATLHLISLGHRRLLHLAGTPRIMTTPARTAGFLDAAKEAGIPSDHAQVVEASFDWKQGYVATLELYKDRNSNSATGVFAANDLCAQGVLSAFRDLGIRCPEDVAIVGYDDTPQAETTNPTLTSVHMGVAELGELALKLLIQRLEHQDVPNQQLVLPVRLTVRESCGAAKRVPFVYASKDSSNRSAR